MNPKNHEDTHHIKETMESPKKPLKKELKDLNVWNDLYARVFLDGNTAVIEDMINAALEKENIKIVEMRTQEQKNNLKTKNVIFDGLAIDEKGQLYAIEIQNRHELGFEERLAYEAAVLIQMTLKSGQKYKEKSESTLIAFCKFKPRGVSTDQVIYNVGRVFLETGERYPDGEKIVIVNGSKIPDTDTPIGKVIHDMYEESAENMLLDSFKQATHKLKETEEGATKMREVQQMIYDQGEAHGFIRGRTEGRAEGRAVGRTEGRIEGLIEGAVKMIEMMAEMNMSVEEIQERLERNYSHEITEEALSQTGFKNDKVQVLN